MNNATKTKTMKALQLRILAHLTTVLPGLRSMIRSPYKLLMTGDASAKLRKGETSIYGMSMPQYKLWINRTTGLGTQVKPANLADWFYCGNVCPHADGCVNTCIAATGHYGMGQSFARAWVRVLWTSNRPLFLELLTMELTKINAKARKVEGNVAVRLNVTSDVEWERYIDMAQFESIQFYDYTKSPTRPNIATNYDITFSVTRRMSVADIRAAALSGKRLAVVVPTKNDATATTFAGLPAVNGDISDERFLDLPGTVVLLRVKRPTNGARIADIYDGGMVRTNDGYIAEMV